MRSPLLSLVCISLAVACTQPLPPDPAPAPGSTTITPSGGNVEARGAGGATLRLEFPAGAVSADVAVSVEPLSTSDGTLAAFRVKPAGARLQKPVTLRLTRPGLPARAAFTWRVGDRQLPLPSSLAGETLTATTRFLGAAVSSATPLSRARALETNPDGADLSVRVLDCESEAFQVTQALSNAAHLEQFDEAVRLGDQLEALRTTCVDLRIAQIEQRVCDDWAKVELEAQVVAVTAFEQFRSLTTRLLNARAMVQWAGAGCGSDVTRLLTAKFEQFSVFLETRLQTLERSSTTEILRELRRVFGIAAQCQLLALETSVCAAFEARLYPLALNKLRLSVYTACQGETGAFGVAGVLRLFAETPGLEEVSPYKQADLETDVMHCSSANNLQAIAFDNVPTETARASFASSPAPTSEPYTLRLDVPRDGSLSITGRTVGQTCVRFDAFDEPFPFTTDANLVLRINTREIARRTVGSDGFYNLTPALEVNPARDLPRAGLDPSTAKGFSAELWREGGNCPGHSDKMLLYTVQVNLTDAPPPPPPATVVTGGFQGTYTIGSRSATRCVLEIFAGNGTRLNGPVRATMTVGEAGSVFRWDQQNDQNARNDPSVLVSARGIQNGAFSGSAELITLSGLPERVSFVGTLSGTTLTVNIRGVTVDGQTCNATFVGEKTS
jgi:hypothetical protein